MQLTLYKLNYSIFIHHIACYWQVLQNKPLSASIIQTKNFFEPVQSRTELQVPSKPIYTHTQGCFSSFDSPIWRLLRFRGKKHNSGNRGGNAEYSSMRVLVSKRNTFISFSYPAESSIFSSALWCERHFGTFAKTAGEGANRNASAYN